MRKLRHKNIISLEAVFDESDYIYLVMELYTSRRTLSVSTWGLIFFHVA